MSTATQYNPNQDFNEKLIRLGLSKTVYALVTTDTENVRRDAFGLGDCCDTVHDVYLDMFRDAWTQKQDAMHREFFDLWCEWSRPVVELDRDLYPFFYPTAGASEPIRHLIYDHKARFPDGRILFFEGEYEGYKAMAEAAGLRYTEVPRETWRDYTSIGERDLFFVSQPSAIDGNVWDEFNRFVAAMPNESLVVDVTYVGAIPRKALCNSQASGLVVRFNLNAESIRNIVFSLSKPFGAYYDRIGGCFSREEDAGLFGNRWFKNLTSIRYGTKLMERISVFELPERYARLQQEAIEVAREHVNAGFCASDVYILAHDKVECVESEICEYLVRANTVRICLTPFMARQMGTSGEA